MTEWKVITAITLAIVLTALVATVTYAAYADSQRTNSPAGTYASYGTNNNGVTTNAPTGTTPIIPQTPTTPPTIPTYPQNI